MIAYLDTNVVVWLAQGSQFRITHHAQRIIEKANLLVSPMVLVELEYLFEIGRIKVPSRDIMLKIEYELGAKPCEMALHRIANVAIDEKWTRDPFDRMIVANAKANGLSALVSADEEIRLNYPKAVW